jgi:hypothetical protein
MSVITKQLVMNQMKLPMDMINVIKEYAFYNIEEQTKKNKLKLHRVIILAEFTRANKFNNDPDYSDDDPHWSFGFEVPNDYNEQIQLQGNMCFDCGQYHHMYTLTNYKISENAICKCGDEEYDYQEDEGSDYDDY